MKDYPEIFLLRHGQTVWNLAGQFQGRQDSPLTALGRQQAAMQGDILRDAGCGDWMMDCFNSPQKRASDTAAIALGKIRMTGKADVRLCEIAFGDFEGLTLLDVQAQWPGVGPTKENRIGWQFHAPGGETLNQIWERCQSFLDQLSQPSIIVTHGITGHVLRGIWLGQNKSEIGLLPGGQGCVFHLKDGVHRVLGNQS